MKKKKKVKTVLTDTTDGRMPVKKKKLMKPVTTQANSGADDAPSPTGAVRAQASSDESITIKCRKIAQYGGAYPPKHDTWWGNRMQEEEFDDIWAMWEGMLSFMGKARRDALKTLMVGLASSQVWEVYTFIRDLGVKTERKRTAHSMVIDQAISDQKKLRAKLDDN